MLLSNAYADAVLCGLLLTTLGMAWVVLLVRINGLRSFSKMTNFDFVMTVAVGSTLSAIGQATSWSAALQASVVVLTLFVVQFSVAWVRRRSDAVESVLGNEPVLLMRDGAFDEEAMRSQRVARSDIWAKLREANVLERGEVRAVVLETTGDVSVLHGDALDEELLTCVRT